MAPKASLSSESWGCVRPGDQILARRSITERGGDPRPPPLSTINLKNMRTESLIVTDNLKIPVFFLGDNPKILLMAGIHGNEQTGVLILRTLTRELSKKNRDFPVVILPAANPEALKLNSRINPKDGVDLNRIFPVKKVESQSYAIGKVLQKFAEQFEIIIDFHVFVKQKTLICGVELGTGGRKTQRQIRSLMSALELDAICRIDHKNEPAKDGSLCAYLQSLNKLAFGVELPPDKFLTKLQKGRTIKSLLMLAYSYKKIIRGRAKDILPIFVRQQFFSPGDGRFIPQAKIGNRVTKHGKMGILVFKTGRRHIITSPFSGKLISISYKRRTKKGEKLFVVGELINSL